MCNCPSANNVFRQGSSQTTWLIFNEIKTNISNITDSTIYRPPDRPDGATRGLDTDPDLDNFYMLLDPHLRPASPDLNDPNSVALFNEHKHLAQEYLKVQTEIALLSQKKDKLLAVQTVEQQKTHDNIKRLQNEKEQLMLFKETLMKQQEILQGRNGHDEWVMMPR